MKICNKVFCELAEQCGWHLTHATLGTHVVFFDPPFRGEHCDEFKAVAQKPSREIAVWQRS